MVFTGFEYSMDVHFNVLAGLGADRRRSWTRLGWLYDHIRSSQVHERCVAFFRGRSESEPANVVLFFFFFLLNHNVFVCVP